MGELSMHLRKAISLRTTAITKQLEEASKPQKKVELEEDEDEDQDENQEEGKDMEESDDDEAEGEADGDQEEGEKEKKAEEAEKRTRMRTKASPRALSAERTVNLKTAAFVFFVCTSSSGVKTEAMCTNTKKDQGQSREVECSRCPLDSIKQPLANIK